jgi:hypothetical protein
MYRVRVVVTDRGPRLVTTRGLERMEQGKPLQWQPGWGRRDAVVVAAQYELRFEAQYGDGPADTAPPESTADGVLVPVAVRELYRQFSDPLWNPAADGLRPRNEDHGLRYWEGRLPIARLAAATVTVRRLEPAAGAPVEYPIPVSALPSAGTLAATADVVELPEPLRAALPPGVFSG